MALAHIIFVYVQGEINNKQARASCIPRAYTHSARKYRELYETQRSHAEKSKRRASFAEKVSARRAFG